MKQRMKIHWECRAYCTDPDRDNCESKRADEDDLFSVCDCSCHSVDDDIADDSH